MADIRYQTIIIIALVISTSTGIHLRRLIKTTASHLIALIVGFFWFLGEFIPCVAIVLMIHQLLIGKKHYNQLTIRIKDVTLTIKQCIIVLFVCLYFIELILIASCSLKKGNDCDATLTLYRDVFFHIQLYISVIYIARPWDWNKFDLKELLKMLGRVFISYSKYVDCTRADIDTPNSTLDSGSAGKMVEVNIKSVKQPTLSRARKTHSASRGRARQRRVIGGPARNSPRVTRRAYGRCKSPSIKILQNARNLIRVQVFKR